MKRIIVVIMAFMMLATGCGKGYNIDKRDAVDKNEIEYKFSDFESYENSIEIEGQWGSNPATGPDGQYGIGDPFVMRFDGKYYLYPSTSDGMGGIKVFVSNDLINWEYGGYAVSQTESSSVGAYAPEVIYYNGNFYMCQSKGGKGHYIYKSDSPLGEFKLISSNLGKGIDGSFYLSDEGKLYLMHTSTSSGLMYAEFTDIDNIEGAVIGASKPISEANLNHWIEGPGIFRRGDISYLTYTGNHVISPGYRVAYSYVNDIDGLGNFIQPENNVTIISTKKDFLGLGHSSNVIGRDLDSVYTAYHNLTGNGPSRRYNVDRYTTNGKYLMPNGVTDYKVDAPKIADYEIESGSSLVKNGKYYLSDKTTENCFTAEFNFLVEAKEIEKKIIIGYIDENNYFFIRVRENKLSLYNVDKTTEKLVCEAEINGNNYGKINTIRVESGYNKGFIYYNNMRKLTFSGFGRGGKIGYTSNQGVSYTAFCSDVFGTSDFETVKNLPTAFSAMSYLKGENRGFRFSSAKVKADGVRQGEKESSFTENDCTTLELKKREDYVKYAVNASETSKYAVVAELTAKSAGAQVEVIVDSKNIYKFDVPKEKFQGNSAKIFLGHIDLEKGKHTLKVRLYSGKLEVVNFEIFADYDTTQNYENKLTAKSFTSLHGDYTVSEAGSSFSDSGVNMAVLDLNGFNYSFSMDTSIGIDGMNAEAGIVFRMKNYSYFDLQAVQSFQGYYLSVKEKLLTLYKYNYGSSRLALKAVTDSDNVGYFQNGKINNISITAVNNKINVYVNDILVIEAEDNNAFYNGGIGIYTKNSAITVKNFKYNLL